MLTNHYKKRWFRYMPPYCKMFRYNEYDTLITKFIQFTL